MRNFAAANDLGRSPSVAYYTVPIEGRTRFFDCPECPRHSVVVYQDEHGDFWAREWHAMHCDVWDQLAREGVSDGEW